MKKTIIRGKILLGSAMVAGLLVSGCGDSENYVFTNTVPVIVPAPPVAVGDSFKALGNATVTYTAANGVLTNDTVNGATIASFDGTGSNGGTVVLNADGSLSYTPVFGFVGSETFDYTLSNADGDSTATVTMTSSGQGFFVNNQAGATGNGSQADPFDTLSDAIAVAGNGDTIFVSRGDGSSLGLSTDVTLPEGVDLIGEGRGLILGQTIVPQGQAPVINASVTITGNNTISGLTFEGTTDDSIVGNGFTNVTITDNTFLGGDTIQVALEDAQGTITISDNTFSMDNNIDATDIDTAAAGTCTFVFNNNTFQALTPTADPGDSLMVAVEGTTVATIQMNDNVFTGLASGDTVETGLSLLLIDDSQTTLTASGNASVFLDNWMVATVAGQSTLMATATGNSSDQISGSSDVDLILLGSSTATLVYDNNSFTNTSREGIELDAFDTSTVKLALRNNTITGARTAAVSLHADDDSDFCAEITGNTFGEDLVFEANTTGDYDVEQFGNAAGDVLSTLNSFEVGGIVVSTNPVNSVADGDCMIP